MKVVPVTIAWANAFVAIRHRHNAPTVGGRFAIAALDERGGCIIGVAIVGRTVARNLHDDLTAEVTRLAVRDGAPDNTCSFLYGACRRIWMAMGGKRLLTYTLCAETGASPRGAGWKPVYQVKGGRQWGNKKRPRAEQAVVLEKKVRWEAAIAA